MASIIYLTDTRFGQQAWQHPSARHRCYHYADALLANGQNAVVLPLEQATTKLLTRFDHAIFHRPMFSKRFQRALDCCRQASVQTHADYDDLIFDPEFAGVSPLYLNGNRSIDKVREQFDANLQAAGCFHKFITSTRFLAQRLQHLFVDASITVLPNSLPRLFNPPIGRGQKSNTTTIGYFPGSNGHAGDLRSVATALSPAIGNNVRLLVAGRMTSCDTEDLPNVIHLPFADYNQYLGLLSQVDVSIAPLQDNDFNRSKSAVKLIESVAVGTPIIASTNPDMQDHQNTLTTLVDHTDDVLHNWRSALDSALNRRITNDQETAATLADRYSVQSRLPILEEHLQCAA